MTGFTTLELELVVTETRKYQESVRNRPTHWRTEPRTVRWNALWTGITHLRQVVARKLRPRPSRRTDPITQ